MLFAVVERAGRPAADILAETSSASSPTSPGPSRCAGVTASLRWVRPLHGIVAMLGEEIVPVEIDGIASGATTSATASTIRGRSRSAALATISRSFAPAM